ncbi:MAG: hypothetical protein ACRDFX_01340 [Chloroflexota bacterium]
MTIPLLLVLLVIIGAYWTKTQILPERRRVNLLRPALADGLLDGMNDLRHAQGLPILELDEELLEVAESKATHQFMTGIEDEGWNYPGRYARLFGKSLLMEMVIVGPAATMGERLAAQTDAFDGEWIRCGIGVAGGQSDRIAVAMVFCRDAWDAVPESTGHRSLLERFALD